MKKNAGKFGRLSSHALELPCNPVLPTLMDIVAITGLKPLGKTYALVIPIKIPHQGEAENWEDDDETCTSKKTSRKRKVPLFVNTRNKDVNVEDHSSSQDYSNLEDDKAVQGKNSKTEDTIIGASKSKVMVSIQTGLKSKQCGLAKDLDALAKQ
ncbi:hypothetical protein JHK87_004385 [Glycine soja]|nr:hypothetical protein JHK87_004385 [Glycine soja]